MPVTRAAGGAARRLLLRAPFGGGTSTRTSDNTHASAWPVLRGRARCGRNLAAAHEQAGRREHGDGIGRKPSNSAGLLGAGVAGTEAGTEREQREQHRDEREVTPSHQLLLFGHLPNSMCPLSALICSELRFRSMSRTLATSLRTWSCRGQLNAGCPDEPILCTPCCRGSCMSASHVRCAAGRPAYLVRGWRLACSGAGLRAAWLTRNGGSFLASYKAGAMTPIFLQFVTTQGGHIQYRPSCWSCTRLVAG